MVGAEKMSNKIGLTVILSLVMGCAYASEPTQLNFNNGESRQVTLSDNNINHILVQNDPIVHIQCPQGLCTANQYQDDSAGSVYLSVSAGKQFTLFIDTQSGRHVSLQVTPKDMAGQTIELIPLSPSAVIKTWETSTPYDQLLISLMKGMMTGTTPDGYSIRNFNQPVSTKTLDDQASFTLVQQFYGDQLIGMHYLMKNLTKKPLTIPSQAFYEPGVRAVAIADQTIQAGSETDVYLIRDRS